MEMNSVDTKPEQLDLWLVKVPKNVGKVWKNSPGGAELGRINKNPDGSLKLFMDPKIQKSCTPPLAHENKLNLKPITHQRMTILTQVKEAPTATNGLPDANDAIKTSFEDLNIQGQLISTGDVVSYMNSKSSLIRAAAKPLKTTIILDKAVASNNPRSANQLAFEAELRRKKDESTRHIKEDKEIVTNRLFSAFQKQQHYNIKDLVRMTNQPLPYLKEILKEICIHCSKGTHKNMWELKPEYRHYKS